MSFLSNKGFLCLPVNTSTVLSKKKPNTCHHWTNCRKKRKAWNIIARYLYENSRKKHSTDAFGTIHLSGRGELILTPENLILSRIDLTADTRFGEDTDLSSLLSLFRKSMRPRHYKRRELDEKKNYFFEFTTKEISFKIYAKIYGLKQNDRCPQKYKK